MIEFSIGPNSKEMHDRIIIYLNENKYEVKHISDKGDHYREILVYGDYDKFAKSWMNERGISYEHWEY